MLDKKYLDCLVKVMLDCFENEEYDKGNEIRISIIKIYRILLDNLCMEEDEELEIILGINME